MFPPMIFLFCLKQIQKASILFIYSPTKYLDAFGHSEKNHVTNRQSIRSTGRNYGTKLSILYWRLAIQFD